MGRKASNLPRVHVRMPDDLHRTLQHRAIDGYRSLNAEIVSLIERGIAADITASAPSA